MLDVFIIGAGPIGLACGIEAKKRGLSYVVVDKGCLVNSIYNYPANMTFFSTSDRLEIGEVPFISHNPKPTRPEALEYYRRVTTSWKLDVRLYEPVSSVERKEGHFVITTSKATFEAQQVVLATGFYDLPYLLNVPGEDSCNVGHAIELVGFALDHLSPDADKALIEKLESVLLASFAAGFRGPGVRLVVSASSGQPTSPYCPWWSLPETIRSAALCHERTGNPLVLDVWRKAHAAFFETYWRGEPAIAYQTMTEQGPVDFVPATPDLDPGYHTGLSLLAAIEVAARMGAAGADKPETGA